MEKWIVVVLVSVLFWGIHKTAEEGCKPCLCIGNVMRCMGRNILQLPKIQQRQMVNLEILILRDTAITTLNLDELPMLSELHIKNNIRISCTMIEQLARKYEHIKISSDCQKSSKRPPTAETDTTPKDGDDDNDADGGDKHILTTFSIIFTTPNGLDINITIPNTTSFQNTTISIEYGKYKLEIITGGVIAVLLTILIVVCVFCCKMVQKYKPFGSNWRHGRIDLSQRSRYRNLGNANPLMDNASQQIPLNVVDPPAELPTDLINPLQDPTAGLEREGREAVHLIPPSDAVYKNTRSHTRSKNKQM